MFLCTFLAFAVFASEFAKFNPEPLPFDKSAFEPVISASTWDFHHGKHYSGYINKVNAATLPSKYSLEDIVLNYGKKKEYRAVVNSAAQSLNHELYFQSLDPRARPLNPESALSKSIMSAYGNWDKFSGMFKDMAKKHFGSGWVFLLMHKGGKVKIIQTHDGKWPGHDGKGVKLLLAFDVWEHAYYLDHQNNRGQYVDQCGLVSKGKLGDWRK